MSLFRNNDRVEQATFRLHLNSDQYQRVQDTVGDLMGGGRNQIIVDPGDTVDVRFDFSIQYRGVVRQLRALKALLADPTVVVDVSLEERQGLDLLFVQFIDAIRDVQAELE